MKPEKITSRGLNSSEEEILRNLTRKWGEKAEDTDLYPERDFARYKSILGLTEQELIGKKILNIGSGFEQMFELESKRKNIDVVSINPNLRGGLARAGAVGEKPVATYVQSLPFPDNSFDYELSLLVVPEHLRPEDDDLVYEEIVRTLKPGGVFISGPHFVPLLQSRENFGRIMKALQEKGCEIELKPVSDPDYNQHLGYSWFLLKIKKPKMDKQDLVKRGEI